MNVKLTCEDCGVIGELNGNEEVLQLAAEQLIQDHWNDAHGSPSVRYDWSDDVTLGI